VNSSAAENLNDPTSLALDGLEGLYDVESVIPEAHPANSSATAKDVLGNPQGTSEIDQNNLGTADWLTVEQAAKKLSITANAVIKRLNKGKLAGTKVPGQWGD
jgi:hypothetical protein